MSQRETLRLTESGSSLGTFLDCQKKYEFKYLKLLSSPYYQTNLGYGSFIHAFLEDSRRSPMPETFLPTDFLSIIQGFGQVIFNESLVSGPVPAGSSTSSPPLTIPLVESSIVQRIIPSFTREVERYLKEYPQQREEILLDAALAAAVAQEHIKYWDALTGDLANGNMEFLHSEIEWRYPVTSMRSSEDTTLHSPEPSGDHVGKSDGVVRHSQYRGTSGKGSFLYELKTSGVPTREAYKHRLELDKQINANLIAMRERGEEPIGVLYDIIWKPALRLKKEETKAELYQRIYEAYTEAPEKYLERLMTFRAPADLEEYEKELSGQYDDLRRAYARGHFHRNSNSCEKFGKLCAFFNSCMGRAPEEEEMMFSVREKKLPELSPEIQQERKV